MLWPGHWGFCCAQKCVCGAPMPMCSPTVPMAKLTVSWRPLTFMPTHTPPSVLVPRCVSMPQNFINEHYKKTTCHIYVCLYVLMSDGYEPCVLMWKARSLLLISTSAPPVCLSCSARSDSDTSSSLFGAGAGDALWLQLSPSAASAAPCWQTHHSGGGPCHSRIRGRNPFSSWFQTLSGAQMQRITEF